MGESQTLPWELQPPNTSLSRKQWWHLLSLLGSWLFEKNLEVHFPFLFVFHLLFLTSQLTFLSSLSHITTTAVTHLICLPASIFRALCGRLLVLFNRLCTPSFLSAPGSLLIRPNSTLNWKQNLALDFRGSTTLALSVLWCHHNEKQAKNPRPARLQTDFTAVWIHSWHYCTKWHTKASCKIKTNKPM